jgi:tRNA/rRNA methyltransferase
MLSAAERSRVAIVLVGARNPSNIGAAARAMQDFGFTDLRFVNEYTAPFEAAQLEATKSAVGAAHVMQSARAYESVAAALGDCTLAIGTTAIGERAATQRIVTLAEAAPQAAEHLAQAETARIALLFGSEKTGLTNEQLSHCAWLTTIPMYQPLTADGGPARHLSMNLGQSVAVCLYELVRDGLEGARDVPQLALSPATGEDRARLTQLLLEAMQQTGYTQRFPANAREVVVRRLAGQLGQDHDEAMTWMGFLKMVLRNKSAEM